MQDFSTTLYLVIKSTDVQRFLFTMKTADMSVCGRGYYSYQTLQGQICKFHIYCDPESV